MEELKAVCQEYAKEHCKSWHPINNFIKWGVEQGHPMGDMLICLDGMTGEGMFDHKFEGELGWEFKLVVDLGWEFKLVAAG